MEQMKFEDDPAYEVNIAKTSKNFIIEIENRDI